MNRAAAVVLLVVGLVVAFGPRGCESDGWTLPIPTPTPDDRVDPDKTAGSWVLIFEETANRSPEAAAVIRAADVWAKTLEGRGLKYRRYDVDQADQYRPFFSRLELPAVVIIDAGGTVLDSGPLPESVDQLDTMTREATGR